MKKTSLFLVALALSITSLQASVELDYLNALRTKTGISAFNVESNLDTAAQNHSDYMQINGISGHYEDSTYAGYTGYDPLARVLYAGYLSRIVGENVSTGQATVEDSIDALFSAIYHRFGFLNLTFNEVGIGINDRYYTYDMGNSIINTLCESGTYTGGSYVTGVCEDSSKKIDLADWNEANDINKESAPELIVWPPVNSDDIPPVFYEESPDPLPAHSVTGYPVSVEFNDAKFDTAPEVTNLVLKEESTGNLQDRITLMNASNDPNSMFTVNQTALFTEKRLEWGHRYSVDLTYTYSGATYTNSWCFSTRSLDSVADKFYRIENNADITLDVISGETYAFYVVPNHSNDTLGSASWSYTSDAPLFSYIDSNTVSIKISGQIGAYASFTFGNGQKVKLILSQSDTAIIPEHNICSVDSAESINESEVVVPIVDFDGDGIADSMDSDDDNDGISDADEIANGLNPLNASDAQADYDNDGFSNVIEISVGSNMRDATIKPVWTPVMVGDIITFVPSFL